MPEAAPTKRGSILGLLGDASIYGVGMMLSRFVGIIITPILTRLFSVAEYGTLDMLQSGLAITIALASLYSESAMMRHYYDHQEAERRSLLFTQLATVALIGCALIALLMPASGAIASGLLRSQGQAGAVRASLWVILSSLLYQHAITVLRTTRRPRLAVACSLSVALAQFLLVLLLVVKLGLGLEGVLLARALAEGLGSVVAIAAMRAEYNPRYSWALLRRMLRFGLPMMPEVLMGVVIGYCGRFFLLGYHGSASLGLFSLAQKLSLLIALTSGALKSAWLPYAFSVSNQGQAEEIYVYVFGAYLKIMAVLLAGVFLFSRELILLLATKEYLPTAFAAGLLALTAALQGLGYIVNVGILVSGRTEYYLLASLGGGVAALVSSALLIPAWGLNGAAAAQLVTQSVMLALIYLVARKLHPIGYPVAWLGLFAAGMLLLSLINLGEGPLSGLAARLVLAGPLFVAAVLLLRRELAAIKELALGRLGVAS